MPVSVCCVVCHFIYSSVFEVLTINGEVYAMRILVVVSSSSFTEVLIRPGRAYKICRAS